MPSRTKRKCVSEGHLGMLTNNQDYIDIERGCKKELDELYQSCWRTDVELIKIAMNKGNFYEIKYAVRSLYASALAFDDMSTLSICKKMLEALSVGSRGMSASQLFYVNQNLELLKLMGISDFSFSSD